MRKHFTQCEDKLRARILVFKELINESGFVSEPCPLLVKQLEQLAYQAEELLRSAKSLAVSVQHEIERDRD